MPRLLIFLFSIVFAAGAILPLHSAKAVDGGFGEADCELSSCSPDCASELGDPCSATQMCRAMCAFGVMPGHVYSNAAPQTDGFIAGLLHQMISVQRKLSYWNKTMKIITKLITFSALVTSGAAFAADPAAVAGACCKLAVCCGLPCC